VTSGGSDMKSMTVTLSGLRNPLETFDDDGTNSPETLRIDPLCAAESFAKDASTCRRYRALFLLKGSRRREDTVVGSSR
jgi:hypothetical protein